MGNFAARLMAVLSVVVGGAVAAFAETTVDGAGCAPDTLELKNGAGVQRFSVEVVDDAAERAQGLMFRESMPSAAGMLFVYERPNHAVFWMKNTLIPLDMIFADRSGLVTHVHSNAIPHDETPIDGGEGVVFVLEINGGLAKRMGIAAGSMMRGDTIEQSGAIWPCNSK